MGLMEAATEKYLESSDRQLPHNDRSWPDLDEGLLKQCERLDALMLYWNYRQVRRLGLG